jgi:formylglycine-generating enzyme required for sulfatase activity
MQKRIFISYRRKDSEYATLGIRKRLEQENDLDIFQDITNIPDGYDFRDYLREGVAGCDVLLVIIGDKWLSVTDEHGERRLDNLKDFVRIEIEAGLERRPKCLVLPILLNPVTHVEEDALPDTLKPLATLNSCPMRPMDFEHDIQRVLNAIRKFDPNQRPVAYPSMKPTPTPTPTPKANFNATTAVEDYYTALNEQNWTASEALLNQIARYKEQHPQYLKMFDVEMERQALDLEQERARQAQEAEEQRVIRDANYDILKNTAQRFPQHLRRALEAFWAHYPAHDPDNLESLIPVNPLLAEKLAQARTFTGKRNRDWKPIIVPLGELVAGTPMPKMEMCLVPVGAFKMGEGDNAHPQTITTPYWIARYTVTNAQWREGVGAGAVNEPRDTRPYKNSAMADCPVVYVTWHQALAFAQWARCTLPSELETEYAGRGVESLVYPWGNEYDATRVVDEKDPTYGGYKHPAPVTYKPEGVSWVGAMHLSGNVWQWQRSLYKDYPYQAQDGREDIINNISEKRVLRGGSFNDPADLLRSALRYDGDPAYNYDIIGFRCALSLNSSGH